MLKGFAFKVLPPKDIVSVLSMMGVHPVATQDHIDRPTQANAVAFFNALAEFAYDMEAQQVKAQIPETVHYPEIYDEAVDALLVFKLSRQLAMINLVDDFNIRDIWDPIPKRFRALLSGMINFCRYKEAKVIVITGMKEDVQALDNERLMLVDRLNQTDTELAAAQDRHNAELHEMWTAENEAAAAKAAVDKLTRNRSYADRVVEDSEKNLATAKEKKQELEQRAEQLRDQVEALQEQVAESPEGLEKEIQDLQTGVRQQKSWLEEKANERRSRAQRDQILARLASHVDSYHGELLRLQKADTSAQVAKRRTVAASEELAALRQKMVARAQEAAELEQAVRNVVADTERAKQSQLEKMRQLEVRRQVALEQHKNLQAKRSEEQKQMNRLQSQRMELEAELASRRRAHEAEMSELRAKKEEVLESAEAYSQSLEALIHSHGAPEFLKSIRCNVLASPNDEEQRQRYRVLSSPSPARAIAEGRLLMSPPPLPGMRSSKA
eukprot:TRINITY_DN3769_c0_g2_i2.p1 TRINITY_DN3769_c0_g2~~TRINITY_DN3769_c0_g2_i2.p1  ORF type:complete len:497 (+),score=138.65 TRINITY_DN3769_c0_g2_i2:82-1572(+)